MPKVKQEYYPLKGGLDLITPAIEMAAGRVIDSQNYEPNNGVYSRIYGYEVFDGHASPSSASYWLLGINQTGSINIGDTVTGVTSGATAKVLKIVGSNLVIGRLTGAFVIGENLTDSGTVGTTTTVALIGAALSPSDDADYNLLAANDQRLNISKVPGSGPIRGVWIYKDNVYAFRDNVGGTAGNMWVETPSGWSQITFGRELFFTSAPAVSATVTITIASPAVVTYTAHGFTANRPVQFSTTGTLPTGIVAGTTYYVIAAGLTANTFEISATVGGTAINTSGSQSGTHTCTAVPNVNVGDTVTGASSGATAVVKKVLLRTGTWTNAGAGSFVFSSVTGAFTNGENLKVTGAAVAIASSADSSITRLPGGQMEFDNINFTGSTATQYMYGVDGVNTAFEYDGTTYTPIHTGMAADTPSHIKGHKFYLFLSFLGSVQFSALGNPYAWTVVLGAGEIAVGDTVSGFAQNGGNIASGSTLQILTSAKLFTLYGTSSADFRLVTSIPDMGFSPFTAQLVSNDVYGFTARGVQAVITTLTFGDFDYASITHEIQPLIMAKRGTECASTVIKSTNQYRVFFSDGTALAVGLTGEKVDAIMPLNYGIPVRCIVTQTLSSGKEVTYFGSDDGFIYQDNIGTSQNGNAIEAWCRMPFNHSESPQILKTYRRAILEGKVTSYSQINVSYDLGYGSPDILPSAPSGDLVLNGAGGYWDQFIWDNFVWDAQIIAAPVIKLTGTATNISILFYSNRAQDNPHTLQGITIIYSPRRLSR